MGSKGIHKISSVLICALMLGLILGQVQAEVIKSCCKSEWARRYYDVCTLKFSQSICARACDCKIVGGITDRSQCPDGYKDLSFIPEFDEPNRTEFCRLGCRSSVCNNMNNDDGIEGMKAIVERCGEGCDLFCKGDANIASVVA